MVLIGKGIPREHVDMGNPLPGFRFQWLPWLVVAAALAAMVYLSRSPGTGHGDIEQLTVRLDAMDASIRALQAQQSQSGFAPMRGDSNGLGSGNAVALRASVPSTPPDLKLDQDNLRRGLEAGFAAQGPAPVSDGVPQQVMAAFNSDAVLAAGSIPESKDVHCRSSTCLIQARFAAGADDSDWATRVMLEVGQQLPDYSVISLPRMGGGVEVRIYATRPGGRGARAPGES